MTSALVSKFRTDTAKRLLKRFNNGGATHVAISVSAPVDPLAAPVLTPTYTDIPAVVRGVSASMVTADPNLVISDLQVIVAALDYIPVVGAVVGINSMDKRILRVDAIPAAGLPAVYKFFVR